MIGVSFSYIQFVTIGLMSLERFVLFWSPNFYIRCLSTFRIKTITFCTWLIGLVMYYYVRFGLCLIGRPNGSLYDVVDTCNKVTFMMYFATIGVVLITSYACYWKIGRIIKSDPVTHSINARSVQEYRSTTLVFVYVITVTITAIGYSILLLGNLERIPLRLSNDSVNAFNSMLDPFVYVLWYKECRMEMLKMLTCGTNIWQNKLEKMRRNIFDVVTIESKTKHRRSTIQAIFVGNAYVCKEATAITVWD